ncbi:MAG: 3-deoxy-manno-octulosonate cytidylyltransferase [Woeseia sp.]|nr:3-deoxy-manno-octulosonate cytidylyltransferase [Woeseia sp.]MBT8097083.1 3-deoxy-manno-octulosonate cytidylyltransferase [Woeseia sp.]NNE62061.1 3-deoxy-manno-octulosonate cytidylyltransferase [Woeseia sp.]NNL53672.1 3-deoxy-manno-octulosonate cytidylyltransferase [Woeseia sp.]
MNEFKVVIPARFASERLPGKPLCKIAGKPMIEHVYERAVDSHAQEVIIATDDERIAEVVRAFGGKACMTRADHHSGTDRLAEVCDQEGWQGDVRVVNLQGDEPLMPAELIDQCAALLEDPGVHLSTLASPLSSAEDFRSPHVVKVVRSANGNALYFSRAPIPFARSVKDSHLAQRSALHHHGIYGYRVATLKQLVATPPSDLETCERLEQLRALSLGLTIRVGVPSKKPGPGVDTEDDLLAISALLA